MRPRHSAILAAQSDTPTMELDFWVGEWDAYNEQGDRVGSNSTLRHIDGCMLLESWTGAGGIVDGSTQLMGEHVRPPVVRRLLRAPRG